MPPVYECFDFDISDDFNEHTTSTARGRYGLEKDGLAHATTDYLQRIYDFCKQYWEIGGLREARGYAIPLRFLRQAAEAKMNNAMFNLGENTGGQEASLDMGVISDLVTSAVATGLNSQKRELMESLKETVLEAMAVFLQELSPRLLQGDRLEPMDIDYSVTGLARSSEPTGRGLEPSETSSNNIPTTSRTAIHGPVQLPSSSRKEKNIELTVACGQEKTVPDALNHHLQELFRNPEARFKSVYQEQLVRYSCDRESYVIAILPTGGGKSLAFELPASYESCKTIVLSPFISLLDDMVRRGKELKLRVKKWTADNQGTDQDRLLYVPLESYTSKAFKK